MYSLYLTLALIICYWLFIHKKLLGFDSCSYDGMFSVSFGVSALMIFAIGVVTALNCNIIPDPQPYFLVKTDGKYVAFSSANRYGTPTFIVTYKDEDRVIADTFHEYTVTTNKSYVSCCTRKCSLGNWGFTIFDKDYKIADRLYLNPDDITLPVTNDTPSKQGVE